LLFLLNIWAKFISYFKAHGKQTGSAVSIHFSCIVLLAYKTGNYQNGYIVKAGDNAPDFVINEAGGKSYRLSDLRGKVVMLHFTASWCGVCRTEMPFIEKEIWQETGPEGLIVIGIDRDEPDSIHRSDSSC